MNFGTSLSHWRIRGGDVQPVLIHRQQRSFFHTREDKIHPHHGRLELLDAAQLAQFGHIARDHKSALWEMKAKGTLHKFCVSSHFKRMNFKSFQTILCSIWITASVFAQSCQEISKQNLIR